MTIQMDKIEILNMDEIFADEHFNCRGKIVPIDVLDLVRDIEKNGLQNPIMVQPYEDKNHPNKKYRIVAGYRRFTAFTVLKKKQISCIVRSGLTELDARRLNLQENLIRKQLNIMQEAQGLKPFHEAGWTEQEVAEQFQQSRGWVQVRYMLLKLHPDIQKDAAAGLLTQENIRQVFSMPETQRFDAVKEIKERKERGEKRVLLKKQKQRDPLKRKQPTKDEIEEMIEKIGKVIGMGLHTRLLAWTAGNISDLELMRDLKEYCDENGVEFEVPVEMEGALYAVGSSE